MRIPVLGVVENMSTHICQQCGHEEAIFASGGGQTLAQSIGVSLLGQLPLALSIREQVDQGNPTMAFAALTADLAQRYLKIALKMSAKLANLQRSDAHKFPKITVK